MRSYGSTLFKSLLPDLSDLDVTIDRIHRLPKLTYLSDQVPGDVILRLHFYHVKEKLMMVMRKHDQIPSQYQNLQFYADLSQHTLQKMKNLNTVIKVLRNHMIIYRWGYPTKITITKEGQKHVVDSLEKGLSLLKEWKILPESIDDNDTTRPVRHLTGKEFQKKAKSHV